jgi:hypothetical protein
VDVASATAPTPGQPRSERDAAFLERFDAWMQLPIVVSSGGRVWIELAGAVAKPV